MRQSLVQALRTAGMKLTPQRLAIVDCLVGDQTHPTAQTLFERLRGRFPTLSMATVYNTLSALTAVGGVRPLEMKGATRFDPNTEPHHHAVCECCGAIRDVAAASGTGSPGSPALEGGEAACPLPGFRVHRVERIYRGICALCHSEGERGSQGATP